MRFPPKEEAPVVRGEFATVFDEEELRETGWSTELAGRAEFGGRPGFARVRLLQLTLITLDEENHTDHGLAAARCIRYQGECSAHISVSFCRI